MLPETVATCETICVRIGDKILEQGLFTDSLGSDYDLAMTPVFAKKLTLQISITSEVDKIDFPSVQSIASHCHDSFFNAVESEIPRKEFQSLKKVWKETTVVRGGKILFAIDEL